AVDDDVAGLQMGAELVDDVVDRLAGLDHDDDRAGARERGDEFRDRLGGREATLRAMRGDYLVRPSAMAVVDRAAETLAGGVAGESAADGRQAENADIVKLRHGFLPLRLFARFLARLCGRDIIAPKRGVCRNK